MAFSRLVESFQTNEVSNIFHFPVLFFFFFFSQFYLLLDEIRKQIIVLVVNFLSMYFRNTLGNLLLMAFSTTYNSW